MRFYSSRVRRLHCTQAGQKCAFKRHHNYKIIVSSFSVLRARSGAWVNALFRTETPVDTPVSRLI
jgi:hypothetical protein